MDQGMLYYSHPINEAAIREAINHYKSKYIARIGDAEFAQVSVEYTDVPEIVDGIKIERVKMTKNHIFIGNKGG